MDKVPNQRIVPFVEDHRNLLILAPVHALPLETMATLQAALKRGVELTFQIEESELVAEPLPKLDARRALLFYEAAEGGAGVLTRLANDSASLALVAQNALRLLHHRDPADGIWRIEDLPALEETNDLGNHICEAGCYQCLLSYFNQPDHEHINRRNPEVLKLLVAMANAQVKLRPSDYSSLAGQTGTGAEPTDDTPQARWLAALHEAGFAIPDALNIPVNQGVATAAAQYKAARALVFLSPVDAATAAWLQDKGWKVLDFSEPEHWSKRFAEHPAVFGLAN